VLAGAFENVGILVVREYYDDLGIEAAIGNGVEDRLAIRTRTGTQYGKTETHNAAHSTRYAAIVNPIKLQFGNL